MEKQCWEMVRKEFGEKSKKYYDEWGNDMWLDSKYHCKVWHGIHNQTTTANLAFVDYYHIQHIINAIAENKTIPKQVLEGYKIQIWLDLIKMLMFKDLKKETPDLADIQFKYHKNLLQIGLSEARARTFWVNVLEEFYDF